MHLKTAVAAALVAAASFTAAAGAASPSCLTPVAADEPLCNPYAGSDFAIAHRNSYEQDSTPYAGPTRAQDVRLQHVLLHPGTLPYLMFSPQYADGGRAAWYSEATQPDSITVGKLDVGTGKVLGQYVAGKLELGSISGVYTFLDAAGHFIVGKDDMLTAYEDQRRGDRRSKIAIAGKITLPANALCGSADKLVGIVPLWTGDIAFATAKGMVGVIADDPGHWQPSQVRAVSLSQCRETVSNSIGADENGGIYVTTSAAQYRLRWDGRTVRPTWRVAYRSDGYQGGIRVGTGSGSSPTLMGTAKRDDKLVVITDGQTVMHLLMMWRDRVPKGFKPLYAGADPRLACDVRLDFGDPSIAKAQSEQSVNVRGYGAVVVNNSLVDTTAFDSLPGSLHYTAATLASGVPLNAAHGMERVDWDPQTKTCHVRWVNKAVSIPNAIPIISGASNMVYGVGQRSGLWGLEGVDFGTGASRLWVPAGVDLGHNSVYADTELAPDGSIWTGTAGAADIYRPVKPNKPLALACVDRRHTRC